MPDPNTIWGPEEEGYKEHNYFLLHGISLAEVEAARREAYEWREQLRRERQVNSVPQYPEPDHVCPPTATVADATYHARLIETEIEQVISELRNTKKKGK